ncbi:MAG: hypothetical protein ABIB43_05820 [archaeon]
MGSDNGAESVKHIPSSRIFRQRLDRIVYGQDEFKDELVVALDNIKDRMRFPDDDYKANIFYVGPKDCGQKKMITQMAKAAKVPVLLGSAEDFMRGMDIQSSLKVFDEYLLKRSEYTIIYLDNIQSLGITSSSLMELDFGKEGFQNDLMNYAGSKIVSDELSTKNMLFIVSGCFEDLEQTIQSITPKHIGFQTSDEKPKEKPPILTKVLNEYYGFQETLLEQFPIITRFKGFSEDELYRNLIKPNSYLSKKRKMLKTTHNIHLKVADDAKKEIVRYAYNSNMNIKGLEKATNEVLTPIILEKSNMRHNVIEINEYDVQERLKNL